MFFKFLKPDIKVCIPLVPETMEMAFDVSQFNRGLYQLEIIENDKVVKKQTLFLKQKYGRHHLLSVVIR
ncbi:MAG: hypothetical protein JXK95_02560 [Bacteroidales bacterium]|nr:hypothetical protein [Bacteroidales bacterium]